MEKKNQKGQWGSKFGFLMAAIGSAVGLGNLWGFPYRMGVGGGFAFLVIYLILVALVGIVIMLAELTLGRKTGKGVIAAYRTAGKQYSVIGWISWLAPVLILGFYSMLGGFCIKYAVANFGDIFGASWGVAGAESGAFFEGFFTNQLESVIYTVLFVIITTVIVSFGVSKGIEKFSAVAMPALFFMLVAVIIRSVTLPGASAGLAFMFKPNLEVFQGSGWISVLASAGSQMFFSLSLGMAIMVTYGSYMKKDDDLEQNALIIPFADTILALMAGLAIMPAVFSQGLDPGAGPGLLFVTLQTVFQHMGAAGPIFGFVFYTLVLIAAVTSSISLTEAVISAVMDSYIEKGKSASRSKLTILVGIFVGLEGALVAVDALGTSNFPKILGQGALIDVFDLFAEGLFMPIAALSTALIFGWLKPHWLDDEIKDVGEDGKIYFKMKGYFYFCLKFIVPVIMLLVLAGQINTFFGLGWFG